MELHKYQKECVEWLKGRSALLAIDMGLGKTAITIESCKDEKVLVIAPTRVALNTWPSELCKWSHDEFCVLHGPLKDQLLKEHKNTKWLIITYGGIKWFFEKGFSAMRGRTLVLDESSFIKSPDTKRFRTLKQYQCFAKRVIELSATPASNGMQNLWTQMYMIDSGILGETYYGFIAKNFYTAYDRRLRPRNKANIEAKIMPYVYRLKDSDYLEVPKVISNDIFLELPKDLRGQYAQLKKNFITEIDEAPVIAKSSATVGNKLRQFAQGFLYDELHRGHEVHTTKLDTLVELCESDGDPKLVVINFKYELEMIKKALGDVPTMVGGSSSTDRILRDWNAGNLPILVVHPLAIGHGLNFQYGGHHIIWYCLPWSLEAYMQTNGRLVRQGQKKPVLITRLIMNHTVEVKVAQTLVEKNQTQQSFLESVYAYCRSNN
jgi:SNF2 family DNA or RNA helicase